MPDPIPTPADIPAAKTTDEKSDTIEAKASYSGRPADGDDGESGDSDVDWQQEAAKWKHFSRQNERRFKELEEKARAYDELKDAEKTELERAKEQAQAAEAKARKLEVESLRARVGAKMGVDPDFLRGETEEEVREFAEKLLAWRGVDENQAEPKTPPAASPVGDAGKRGDPVKVNQLSAADMQRMEPIEIFEAYKRGNFERLLTGNS